MRRFLQVLCIGLAFMFTLVGCSDESKEGQDSQETAVTQQASDNGNKEAAASTDNKAEDSSASDTSGDGSTAPEGTESMLELP